MDGCCYSCNNANNMFYLFNSGTNSSVDLWSVANDSLSPIINGNDSWSSITLDGITYEVDLSNFTDTGEVECDEGLFYQESFAYCGRCFINMSY